MQLLKAFGSQLIFLTILGAAVFGLSLVFRLKANLPRWDNPRRRALVALLSVLAGMILSSSVLVFAQRQDTSSTAETTVDSGVVAPARTDADSTADRSAPATLEANAASGDSSCSQTTPRQERPHGGPHLVLDQSILFALMLLPVLLAMRMQKESLYTAGITAVGLTGSIVIGLGVGLLTVLITIAGKMFMVDWQLDHFWSFLQFAIVGFGEEFAFRGYLQTRLVGWLGRVPGWVTASVLMALLHYGHRLAMMGMEPVPALLSCLGLIPISLFLGFVMLRTGNIVAPGIMHLFADWVTTI